MVPQANIMVEYQSFQLSHCFSALQLHVEYEGYGHGYLHFHHSLFEGASPCSPVPRQTNSLVICCWGIYIRPYNHRPSLDKKATGCFTSSEFTWRQETENASSRGGLMEEIIQIRYMIKFCNGEGRICLLLRGN